MTDHCCSRCDCNIDRPYRENANYVVSDDFCCAEPKEVTYALVHTPDTRERVKTVQKYRPNREFNALAAEMARPNAPPVIEVPDGMETVEEGRTQVETTNWTEIPFSIHRDEFEITRVDSPNSVQNNRDVAYTFTETEEQEVQKTGLVCRDCCDPDADEIIWGPDA